MAIDFPTIEELTTRVQASMKAELPDSTPSLEGSFIRALAVAQATRANDVVNLVRQLVEQLFPQTATGAFLERWAGYEDLTRNAAVAASGTVVFAAEENAILPSGTLLTGSNQVTYESTEEAQASVRSITVTGITRSGTVATATTAEDHLFGTGLTITIAGANEAEFNGDFEVTVIGARTFTYTVPDSGPTAATGTILASARVITAIARAQATGTAGNLASGESISLVTPIVSITSPGVVTATGLAGGAAVELDDSLRTRTLQSRANPVANFNATAIEKQALRVAGVTDVDVREVTPAAGSVTIYFLLTGADPIPTGQDVLNVREQVLEILPANSDPDLVFITAPSALAVDFTVADVLPATSAMRDAVDAQIRAFFDDRVRTIGATLRRDSLLGAIANTIDSTGVSLESFTLTAPAADVAVGANELPRPGTIDVA